MNCCYEDYKSYQVSETYKTYDAPVLAEGLRFLFGITLMLLGLYIGLFTDVYGHGLGFLLVFGSPFIMLTDSK